MRARVFLVVFLTVLLLPGVAHAKGPDQATVEGDGLVTPMSFSGKEGSQDDLGKLADVAGLWPAAYPQTPDPMLLEAPKEKLGPKLVITWRLPDGGPSPSFVEQELYLDAAGGPLTYTPPDQPLPGGGATTGGWFRTPKALQPTWETLGLPTKSALASKPAPAQPATKPAPSPPKEAAPSKVAPATSDGGSDLVLGQVIAVLAVAAIALVASRMTFGRRVRVGST